VTREVTDPANGAVRIPSDYSELGALMLTAGAIGLVLPLLVILVARFLGWRSA
jgi:hypothetical protein